MGLSCERFVEKLQRTLVGYNVLTYEEVRSRG